MINTGFDRAEDQRKAQVLAQQADCLIGKLNVTVSDAETFQTGAPEFRLAADAYERIAKASKRADSVAWERTAVDGRNGDELMERLWQVREALRRQG